MILARTVKAKGVPELEDINGWHGKALPADMAARAIAALGGPTGMHSRTALPQPGSPAITPAPGAPVTWPVYALGEKVATRSAFGAAVAALAARPDVVVLDGEVGNSTHAEEFAKAAPDRYFEMFIAEQQLVAAATGLAVRGYGPFASTFAVFFSRAFDFIRMAGISGVNICLVGSHAGVEIGAGRASQMALEDIAALRAVHGSVVLYPADATCDRGADGADGAHRRHRLPAHHPRRLPGDLPGRGGVRSRRVRSHRAAPATRSPSSVPG